MYQNNSIFRYTYEIKYTILNRTHMLTNLKINVIIFKTMFQWEGKYEKIILYTDKL